MSTAKLERWLIALFIVGVIGVSLWVNQVRPRVLVLHSYDTGYAWVRDVNIGIRRILEEKSFYVVRWHYMDLKRYPWPEFRASAGLRARHAIDSFEPDVVIAVDDDAQKYAAMHYVDHLRTKIIFAGINGGIEPYGYDKASNATGIVERKQLAALRDAIVDAGIRRPDGRPPRLLVVGDTSESVKSDMTHIEHFDWKPLSVAGIRLAGTFEEWQAIIHSAGAEADVIITTNYRKLTRAKNSRELVPAAEVVGWSEANSPIPLIGTNGFYVEDGGMMAIGTSGYEQGEVAARYAARIIDEAAAPTSISPASTSQFVVFLRAGMLARRGLALPPLYEAFARATNNYVD